MSENHNRPTFPTSDEMKDMFRGYFPERCEGCLTVEGDLDRLVDGVDTWEKLENVEPIAREAAINTARLCINGLTNELVNPDINRTRPVCGKNGSASPTVIE